MQVIPCKHERFNKSVVTTAMSNFTLFIAFLFVLFVSVKIYFSNLFKSNSMGRDVCQVMLYSRDHSNE